MTFLMYRGHIITPHTLVVLASQRDVEISEFDATNRIVMAANAVARGLDENEECENMFNDLFGDVVFVRNQMADYTQTAKHLASVSLDLMATFTQGATR